jgi:hypothetical protein
MTVTEPVTNGKKPKSAENAEGFKLAEFDIQTVTMNIKGTAPLICHRWSEKAKKQMLDKQMKIASVGKAAKDPEADYKESLYVHPEGGYGFPAVAFKAAAVRAGTYSDMKMTFLRGAFHVIGELVKIEGEPRMREDMVRISTTSDIRYRGEFPEWGTTLTLRFNARAITIPQLGSLFHLAGFAVGVGEWRPEKNGQYGTFEVV